MKSSILAISILITLAFASAAVGQDPHKCPPLASKLESEKIDEFSHISDGDLYINIAVLFERLNDAPAGTYAYVITYTGADALPADRDRNPVAERIRESIARQNQDTRQFVMINGGYRKTDGAEFFFVQSGNRPPSPSNTVPTPKVPKGTFLWAKNIFSEDSDPLEEFVNRAVIYRDLTDDGDDVPVIAGDNTDNSKEASIPAQIVENPSPVIQTPIISSYEPEKPPLTAEDLDNIRFGWANKNFAAAVGKRDNSRGIMILYADDQFYDISRLQYFVEEGRDRMAKAADLDPNLIEVTFGGYRAQPQVEYWLVPTGGNQPIPKPEPRVSNEPLDQ